MSKANNYTNILLAALGTTPQIITESLYYLMVTREITIHQIHLITTTEGRKKAEDHLFQNGQGPFFQFCREYGFSSTEIHCKYHVIENQAGEQLSDIRTPKDNQAAADYFLKIVRQLTSRPETRIFATIAGGRKTMSAYLYFTMQLLGRQQDTLYHVLVYPESIESNPAFYYPRKGVEEMNFLDKEKKLFRVPLKDIRIDMAEIPFVKLNKVVPASLFEKESTYYNLVMKTSEILEYAQIAPNVEINLSEHSITVTGKTIRFRIHLSPTELSLFYFLCKKRKLINDEEHNPENASNLITIYKRIKKGADIRPSFFGVADIRETRSRINKKFRDTIPYQSIRSFLFIESHPPRSHPHYVLPLPSDNITIIPKDLPL